MKWMRNVSRRRGEAHVDGVTIRAGSIADLDDIVQTINRKPIPTARTPKFAQKLSRYVESAALALCRMRAAKARAACEAPPPGPVRRNSRARLERGLRFQPWWVFWPWAF